MEIEFFVEGIPAPQGSKSGFVRNGKVIMVESGGNKHKKWRRLVNEAAKQFAIDSGLDEPIDAPIKATVLFTFLRPKSVKRVFPSVPPDLDKLQRAVFDSLTKVIYVDDSRIVSIVADKRYDVKEGVYIKIEVVQEDQGKLFDE